MTLAETMTPESKRLFYICNKKVKTKIIYKVATDTIKSTKKSKSTKDVINKTRTEKIRNNYELISINVTFLSTMFSFGSKTWFWKVWWSKRNIHNNQQRWIESDPGVVY